MKLEEIKKHTDAIIANGFTFKPDTIEVTEETIKSYHEDACQEFKTRIEKDFPDLFNEGFKVGKWYKSSGETKAVYFLKEIIGTTLMAYGINWRSEWRDLKDFGNTTDSGQEPATDEEVSTALISEAKKRGYKSGNHNCLTIGNTCDLVKAKYFFEYGDLWMGEITKRNLIFCDGLWAEIIKEEPVYEWQYVYYSHIEKKYRLTQRFYKSKKEFLKAMPNRKHLSKVKESKRIRK